MEEVIEKELGKAFHSCEKCGYERGFHVSFAGEGGPQEIVLICPSCGQPYRVGWQFTPTESA
jgi:hypothetical protein